MTEAASVVIEEAQLGERRWGVFIERPGQNRTLWERYASQIEAEAGVVAARAYLAARGKAQAAQSVATMEQLIAWLEFQIKHGHAPDGQPVEMYPLFAEGRRSAFASTLTVVKRLAATAVGDAEG